MADYEVNYRITVDSTQAQQSIAAFQRSTQQIGALMDNFKNITLGIGHINRAFDSLGKKTPVLDIDVSRAVASTKVVLNHLANVQSASKIVMTLDTKNITGKNALKRPFDAMSNKVDQFRQSFKTKLDGIVTDMKSLNTTVITPTADTSKAQPQLQALLDTINQIKSNSKITITATASTKGGTSASKATSTSELGGYKTVITPGRSGTRSVKYVSGGSAPSTPKPSVSGSAGHSTLLFPSTRQVLGPTYANTGASMIGEMIKGMGVMYSLSAIMSGITSAFTDAANYNNITQTTKNILGAHDQNPWFDADFDLMNSIMRQVGVDTRYTAPQVAEAGKFLAMAGYRVEDIQRAIRPITDIALVGDTDLGETADVVTNIMTSYKIPAGRVNEAADILTMTFTKTNSTLMELAESFKYAGTMAYQSGLSFETSSAVFGVLGDAGIKGSQAGTTLRMMLMNILNPTKRQREAWESVGIRTDDGHGNLRNFVDLMRDLNQIKQTMNPYDFSSLISRMFRVTATPGALALINNVDKLSKVVDANYQSDGLSRDLSTAKQNTIQGLWYQMTSAFTEAGMKGFESLQNGIRSFLRQMIAMMKSDSFVQGIRSAMDIFIRLAKVIADVLQGLVSFWNMIPPGLKDMVVAFAKMQMTFNIVAGVFQSIMSTSLMLRGILMGNWLGLALSKIKKIATVAVLANKALFTFAKGNPLLSGLGGRFAANASISRAGVSAAYNSAAGFGGSFAGSAAAGAAANGLKGLSIWSLIKTGITAYPMTTAVVMTAGAIGYLGLKLFDHMQIVRQVTETNRQWAESYRQLGVNKLDMSDPDALMIGNLNIFNNQLLTHNERLAESIRLYQKWWEVKNQKPEQTDDSTPFADTEKGAGWKSALEVATSLSPWSREEAFGEVLKKLGGSVFYRNGAKWLKLGQNEYHASSILGGLSENAALALQIATMGADPNNPDAINLMKYLNKNALKAESGKDLRKVVSNTHIKFWDALQPDKKWNYIEGDKAWKMSEADIHSHTAYQYGFTKLTGPIIYNIQHLLDPIFSALDTKSKVPYYTAQSYLQSKMGFWFNTKNKFGSDSWAEDIRNSLAGDTVEQARNKISKVFQELVSTFSLMSDPLKSVFAPFLNRTVWESLVPGVKLSEGGFIGGKEIGKSKAVINGQKGTWGLSPITGMPVWLNTKNQVLIPQDGSAVDYSGNPSPTNSANDDDFGKSTKYRTSSAPKQVIVRIENLMNVEKVDMTDERKAAVVANLKEELATALLDVVQDFNANI